MGFASLTCSVCKGSGKRTVYSGLFADEIRITCTNCEGTGSILVHTGSIGSYTISIDPAGTKSDETWALLWKAHDDGTIEVREISKLEAQAPEPTKKDPHTFLCTSGLPEGTCGCYACHGG